MDLHLSCSRRRLIATAAVIASSSLAALAPAAHATVGCASASLSEAGAAGSCWHPFGSASPFNTALDSDPTLAPDNSAVQQHMASYGWTMGYSSTGFSIGASEGSRPVYYASPSDPTMTINCTSEEGPGTCTGANGVDINGAQINVPAGAEPQNNWDAHMTVIETATGAEYDLWHTSISGSTITSGTGAETNVNTGDGTGGGGDAAGFSLSAGLLRPSELITGQINHALVVTVPCTNATGSNTGYTWPAAGGWGEFCGQYWNEQASNAPELGQLLKLNMTPAQIAASGAPAWQQTIMTALATYGAYIEDTEGSWHNEGIYILTQSSSSWTDLGQSDQWSTVTNAFGETGNNLSSNVPIPTSKLEMVNTCATQLTCPGAATQTPTPTTNPVTTPHNSMAASARHSRSRRRGHSRRAAARRDHARFDQVMRKGSRRHYRTDLGRHHRADRRHA